jgi:hypothetical protein
MNSQKTYASAVKNGNSIKRETVTYKQETDKRETDKRETDKQETDKQVAKPYCECCRKDVKYVAFKNWCNMFMCDDCENWIMAHGV